MYYTIQFFLQQPLATIFIYLLVVLDKGFSNHSQCDEIVLLCKIKEK